jgi:hypothetical protein
MSTLPGICIIILFAEIPTSLIAKIPTSLVAKIPTFVIAKKPALLFAVYTAMDMRNCLKINC